MQHHDVNELRKFCNRCCTQQADCASCRIAVLEYHFKCRMMNIINIDVRLKILDIHRSSATIFSKSLSPSKKSLSESAVCSLDVDIGSPVRGRREAPSVEAAESGRDEDVACSVAALVLGLSAPAAVSNAFAAAMKDQGGLSIC